MPLTSGKSTARPRFGPWSAWRSLAPNPEPTPKPKPEPEPPPESRPLIRVVDHELPRVVNEVENALIAIGGIYERSGQLVRPIRMRVPAADDRQTTSHRLGLVSASHVEKTATRAAIFESTMRESGNGALLLAR